MNTVEIQRKSLVSRTFYYIAMIVLVIAILFVILISYWLNTSYEPIKATQPFKILNSNRQIPNGGDLIFQGEFCKTIDTEGIQTITLEGKTITDLIHSRENTPEGCNNYPVHISLPKTVNFEPRRLHFHLEYKVNPIRTVTQDLYTEEFYIQEGGE